MMKIYCYLIHISIFWTLTNLNVIKGGRGLFIKEQQLQRSILEVLLMLNYKYAHEILFIVFFGWHCFFRCLLNGFLTPLTPIQWGSVNERIWRGDVFGGLGLRMLRYRFILWLFFLSSKWNWPSIVQTLAFLLLSEPRGLTRSGALEGQESQGCLGTTFALDWSQIFLIWMLSSSSACNSLLRSEFWHKYDQMSPKEQRTMAENGTCTIGHLTIVSIWARY